jgi:predicted Zn finger-like uncharacterized protein
MEAGMRFSCEGCSAKYMISDDKVGPVGVKVRCKKCGHVTHVRRGEPEGAPAPGGALAAEWWAAIGDQPVGPMGIEALQHHWDQGEIGPESLVWYSGLAEWTPLSSVPELHSHLGGGMPAATPAPTPTPAPPPPPSPSLDDEWRPGAASALAALEDHQPRDVDISPREPASAAVAPPAAEPVPSESPVIGTDPTGVVPLPMAGLERTGEKRIPATPRSRGHRSRHTPAPQESRSLTVVLLVALVVVAAVAVGLWWMTK